MGFVKVDLATLDDEALLAKRARKERIVANAAAQLAECEAEVEKWSTNLARVKAYSAPPQEIEQAEQRLEVAVAARRGSYGGQGAARSGLARVMAEIERRVVARAQADFDASDDELRKRAESLLRVVVEAAAAAFSMRDQVTEAAQVCRTRDYDVFRATGAHPVERFGGGDDPFTDKRVLEGAKYGLYETVRALIEFHEGRAGAQNTARKADAEREGIAAFIAQQQGVAG